MSSRNPDIATCRALRSGQGDLFFCLNEERGICDHCLPFGESYFCRHPQRLEIAASTEPQKKIISFHGLNQGMNRSRSVG
jgi:hypothetical protein